jgi:hypothetical protein
VQRLGKIVRERYPELSDADQEAVRQHAMAVMNITPQAKLELGASVIAEDADSYDTSASTGPTSEQGNTALLDGVRKFINVRDLDIDLIDSINPFEAAYAVLAKVMDEKSLRQIQASSAAKKIKISEEDARELARRALLFKHERSRLPDINAADAWEKRMAEGVTALRPKPERPPRMTEIDDDELLAALGVEASPIKAVNHTPREERIIAGFEDILRFHQTHDSAPLHGEDRDIFERLYALRLDQLRKLPEARALLTELDAPGLLGGATSVPADIDTLDEDALLAELGVATEDDISVLRTCAHMRRSRRRKRLPTARHALTSTRSNRFSTTWRRASSKIAGLHSSRKTRFGRRAPCARCFSVT